MFRFLLYSHLQELKNIAVKIIELSFNCNYLIKVVLDCAIIY